MLILDMIKRIMFFQQNVESIQHYAALATTGAIREISKEKIQKFLESLQHRWYYRKL